MSKILFEAGEYWVGAKAKSGNFPVWKNGLTHATSEIEFQDLSVAILYAATSGGRKMRAAEAVALAISLNRNVELPAYRVTCDNGDSYVTSMAANVTLEVARRYFLGQRQEVTEETFRTVTRVDAV